MARLKIDKNIVFEVKGISTGSKLAAANVGLTSESDPHLLVEVGDETVQVHLPDILRGLSSKQKEQLGLS